MPIRNKLHPAYLVFFLVCLILVSCSSKSHLTATQGMNQNASLTPATPTKTPMPVPTSTKEFVSATPSLIPELPARIAYIALGSTDVIGILDQKNKQTILVKNCIFCDSLSWSPDGKWIAFNATFKIGNSQQIFIVNVDNGEIRQITSDSHAKFGLSWSPDGESLIYTEEGDPTDLVITRIDGTFTKKITFTPGYETYPMWSPDGNKIAYLYREARFLEHSELWVMDHDGENRRRVTNIPISFNTIAWSPDGEEILFVSYDDCGKLYSIHMDGSNLQQIVDHPGCIEHPTWSPDGALIMFIGSKSKTSSLSSPSWKIYLMSADGTGISQPATDLNGRPIISIWDNSRK